MDGVYSDLVVLGESANNLRNQGRKIQAVLPRLGTMTKSIHLHLQVASPNHAIRSSFQKYHDHILPDVDMSPVNITFNTPSVPSFRWYESHERLTIQELNELVMQCRGATAAFSTELNNRHCPHKEDEEACYQRLEQTAKCINYQGLQKAHTINMQGLYV